MKNGLIIHGTPDEEEYFSDEYPSCSNSHWIPWLEKQMLMNGIYTQAPEMPLAYLPDYPAWKETFEQFELNEESILVGHSCGAGFLVRYFSENKMNVKRIILVAPWLNPLRNEDKDVVDKAHDFFEFEIDPDLENRTDLHMIYSDDDMKSVNVSVDIINAAFPNMHKRLFKNYGHFCFSDLRTEAFPELRDIVLS